MCCGLEGTIIWTKCCHDSANCNYDNVINLTNHVEPLSFQIVVYPLILDLAIVYYRQFRYSSYHIHCCFCRVALFLSDSLIVVLVLNVFLYWKGRMLSLRIILLETSFRRSSVFLWNRLSIFLWNQFPKDHGENFHNDGIVRSWLIFCHLNLWSFEVLISMVFLLVLKAFRLSCQKLYAAEAA